MKKNLVLFAVFLFVFSSCSEILFEDDISDKAVTLTAPMDNAQFTSVSVGFHWEPVENATQYRLQIVRPDFSNPLEMVTDILVDTNSFTKQLAIGHYQWRVKAINGGYETGYATRSLNILSNEDFQDNTVILTSPENNLITNIPAQTLSWQAVPDATSYQLQVYNAMDISMLDQTVTGTSYDFSFPEGSFSWRVRASNGSGQTMFSSRALLSDTTAPNTPVLTLPANNAAFGDADVAFQWNRGAIAGSVERDSIYIYKNSTLTNLHLKDRKTSPFNATLLPGTYYWYVKAFDEAGNSGNQSTVFSFTIN